MKKTANYSAWIIPTIDVEKLESDTDRLRYFCRYAILSPSGHNTQPWLFRFEKDIVEITVNKSQELPHSGKVAAEPNVSIGACTETLIQAGLAFGYKLKTETNFDPETRIRIYIDGKCSQNLDKAKAIKNRVSNREFYSDEKLNESFLKTLNNSYQNQSSISIFEDKSDIKYLSDKTAVATIKIMSDPAFRNELSKWVRNNITRQHDGMPAFVQGMPTPPSIIAKHIIKNIDISKNQAKKDSLRILKSPAIIVIGLSEQNNSSFFQLGREYARICIEAELQGYSTSGVGAGVIDTNTKMDIKTHFKMTSTPSALIRVGKTDKKAHHSPRFTLEMVTLK